MKAETETPEFHGMTGINEIEKDFMVAYFNALKVPIHVRKDYKKDDNYCLFFEDTDHFDHAFNIGMFYKNQTLDFIKRIT